MSQTLRFKGVIGVVACLLALALPATSIAAFPGANGKIAFSSPNGVETINPDGTGRTVLEADAEDPAWSPGGDKIAFMTTRDGNYEIYVMNADSSNQTRLTNNSAVDSAPDWSPDGSRIVFTSDRDGNREIYTMNSDGSNQTRLTNTTNTDEQDPAWSPAGDKIALFVYSGEIRTMNTDGTAITPVTTAFWHCPEVPETKDDYWPDWSPNGQKLVFIHSENDSFCTEVNWWEIHTINADGTGEENLVDDPYAESPAWSPDGTKLVMNQNGGGELYVRSTSGGLGTHLADFGCCADWQPIPTNPLSGYARPISASPTTVALVPAYKQGCSSGTPSTHGAPLSAPSCNPPQQTSEFLTVGTPDANGAAANSNGYVSFRVFCHPPDANGIPECPAEGDQIDVALTASITDVRNKADLTDYAGEVQVFFVLRITDKYNLPGGTTPGTARTQTFTFNVSCLPTADTSIGSTCSTSTTADALMPGLALERKRAVWELQKIMIYDGGADGDADTGANTLFAVQGLFAP